LFQILSCTREENIDTVVYTQEGVFPTDTTLNGGQVNVLLEGIDEPSGSNHGRWTQASTLGDGVVEFLRHGKIVVASCGLFVRGPFVQSIVEIGMESMVGIHNCFQDGIGVGPSLVFNIFSCDSNLVERCSESFRNFKGDLKAFEWRNREGMNFKSTFSIRQKLLD
jgi:hypothetical protein